MDFKNRMRRYTIDSTYNQNSSFFEKYKPPDESKNKIIKQLNGENLNQTNRIYKQELCT